MGTGEVAHRQLEQYYRVMAEHGRRIMETRKWAVTVWLAIVVATGSHSVPFGRLGTFVLLFLPIFLFWIIEGLDFAWWQVNRMRARRIEILISENSDDIAIPTEYFYASGDDMVPYKKKVRLFFVSTYTAETIVCFYLVLSLLSLAYVLVL